MENRNILIIHNEHYILEEAIVNVDNDIVWEVKDPKTNNSFVVHSDHYGKMYITFFKHDFISSSCAYNAIHKICEILIERNLKPTMNIHYTNQPLIKLCCSIGFRKDKKIKHLYYLKNLK